MPNKLPIATHPQLVQVRITLWGGISIFLFAIVSGIVQTNQFLSSLKLPFPDIYTAVQIGCLAGFFVIWRYVAWHFWLRIECRRLAIVAGDKHQITVIQPNSWRSTSPASQVITLCFKKIHIWFWTSLVFFVCLILLGQFLVLPNRILLDFLPLIGFIVLIILITSILVMNQNFLTRYTVEATDNSLEMRCSKEGEHRWNVKNVQWQDAHLFACYKLPKFLGYETVVYELSSADNVVFWYWLSKPQALFTLWKPVLPIEEYHYQMQALTALITEKTGLPLYDLSQPLYDIQQATPQ